MGRTHFLIAVNLVLVTLIGLSVYNSVKTPTENTIEIPQDGRINDASVPINNSARTQHPKHNSANAKPVSSAAVQSGQADSSAAACFKACQTRILERLITGEDINLNDADLIRQNTHLFAPILASKPNALGGLLRKLQKDDEGVNGNAQLAAYDVITALSDEDRISASHILLTHTDPSYRIVGIELAANAVAQNSDVASAFVSLVGQETNPRVLTALINAIPTQKTDGAYNPETIHILDLLMGHKNSDYIRGSALVTKSQLLQSTSDARADVIQALQAPSNKLRGYGLKAYSVIRNRQSNTQENRAEWDYDAEMQDLLNGMVNDPNLDDENRELALKLVREP